MSQSKVKQLRREAEQAVHAHARQIRDGVAKEILANMMTAPLRVRVKWATRILRGIRRESLWAFKAVWIADWMLDRLTWRLGDLLWPPRICGTCDHGDEGTCSHCAGDNYGHTTEIAGNAPACSNWVSHGGKVRPTEPWPHCGHRMDLDAQGNGTATVDSSGNEVK